MWIEGIVDVCVMWTCLLVASVKVRARSENILTDRRSSSLHSRWELINHTCL